MSMVEPIRIALVKRGNLSESELARRMGISPQNLHNKMNRDNFTESDLRQIINRNTLHKDRIFSPLKKSGFYILIK